MQSVLDQDFTDAEFEVIVVNDGCRPLPAGAWQESPRVRQIETQHRGQSIARNTGAAMARGHYLHFLDDDDWLLPGALAAFWELAQRAPQAGWLHGGVQIMDAAGQVLREFNGECDGNAFAQLLAGMWIVPGASLIRAEAFFAAGGYNPLLRVCEETDLGRRLCHRADMAHTPAAVAGVLRGQGWSTSMTNSHHSTEANRWSRDRALAEPGAFSRLRASARAAYWRGRILQAYLAGARWNLQRGRVAVSASRLCYGLLSLALAGAAPLTRPYWQAVSDDQVPGSAGRILVGL